MKKTLYFFFLFTIALFYAGCKCSCGIFSSHSKRYEKRMEQLSCFDTLLAHTNGMGVYMEVRSGFKDTLDNWIKRNLPYMEAVKNNPHYIDEVVFFNEKANQCILMLVYEPKKDRDNIVCLLFGGEKVSGSWQFYLTNMSLSCETGEKLPLTKEQIIKYSRICLISTYLYPCCCKPDQVFFNEIINEETRQRHKKFLQRKKGWE